MTPQQIADRWLAGCKASQERLRRGIDRVASGHVTVPKQRRKRAVPSVLIFTAPRNN